MKDWKLSEQYAIVALNGLESLHPSMAKDAVLRGIAAAKVFETYMEEVDTVFLTKIEEAVERAKSIKKKEEKELEEEMTTVLKEESMLEIVPDLLGCDINYYTSGVEMKTYRSEESEYLKIREGLRAEILEEGEDFQRECVTLVAFQGKRMYPRFVFCRRTEQSTTKNVRYGGTGSCSAGIMAE